MNSKFIFCELMIFMFSYLEWYHTDISMIFLIEPLLILLHPNYSPIYGYIWI